MIKSWRAWREQSESELSAGFDKMDESLSDALVGQRAAFQSFGELIEGLGISTEISVRGAPSDDDEDGDAKSGLTLAAETGAPHHLAGRRERDQWGDGLRDF